MCLSRTDPTEYGTQYWQILAPRVRKLCKIDLLSNTLHTRTLQEYLFSEDKPWGAWSKLARPATLARTHDTSRFIGHERNLRSLSGIELLPTELIALILQDPALERSDIIALGLASQTLWLHVLRHVEKECLLVKPPLAGTEITCTGSYLTDLPESFAKNDMILSTLQPWPHRYMCSARVINRSASRNYEVLDQEDSEDMWIAAMNVHDTVAAGIPNVTVEKMAAELIGMCSALRGHSPDALWILRNLNTHEYIRCRPGSGPKDKRGFVDHPRVKLRIDDALLLRIYWTSRFREYRSWKDPEPLGTCRGKWAGHSFDIVLLEQADVNGWKDATDSIVRQARTVARNLPDNRGISAITKKEKTLDGTASRMSLSRRKKKLEALRQKKGKRRARKR
jgi:hypothetical protein